MPRDAQENKKRYVDPILGPLNITRFALSWALFVWLELLFFFSVLFCHSFFLFLFFHHVDLECPSSIFLSGIHLRTTLQLLFALLRSILFLPTCYIALPLPNICSCIMAELIKNWIDCLKGSILQFWSVLMLLCLKPTPRNSSGSSNHLPPHQWLLHDIEQQCDLTWF